MKKISIITVNLNNAIGLEATIRSVIDQRFEKYEYIIVDGASNDGSIEVIKKFEDRISFWISEKDSGIYNAMNKGIIKSSGEFCLFLNSGDRLISNDILEKIAPISDNDFEIIYGDGIISANQGKTNHFKVPEKLTLDYFFYRSLFHPSTLIKRDLFFKYGMYNEENRIVSDWEFFIKTIMIYGVKTKYLPLTISVTDNVGISNQPENQELISNECNRAVERYFPPSVFQLVKEYKSIKSELDWARNKLYLNFFLKIREKRRIDLNES